MTWEYEFTLNNSSFTANQWAAINSGITIGDVSQIATNTSNIASLQTNKQDTITSQNKLSADLVEDGTTNKVYTATEQTKLSGIESGAQVNTVNSVNSQTGAVVLDADDISDTNTDNKFVTSTEKATWNAKADTSDIPVLKTFTNTSVSTWVADNTYTGYGYKASITLSGVTADMIPQVIFGADEATSGNYLPIAESYAGGIYIWSKVDDTITIPTITVQKAVA